MIETAPAIHVNKQGTWWQALSGFVYAASIYLVIRWLLIEAFVIPSGSMLPTLLIHDYIFVNKVVYGLRVPFTKFWLVHFSHPQRGDVVVFRSPEDEDRYLIKRVVATAGDELEYREDGQLIVNKEPVSAEPLDPNTLEYGWPDSQGDKAASLRDYDLRAETVPHHHYATWLRKDETHHRFGPEVVPQGQLFMMGDNRDNSHDSRFWGYLPEENILGRASWVWLSCGETLEGSRSICDPTHLRVSRLFHLIR